MSQHLSDEAVAAYADGVLGGIARDRADRHVRDCPECRSAVRVQREAASVLRTASAPPLPSALADRLRSVPMTTPITTLPTAIGPDGSAMLATFGTAAAFVPDNAERRSRSAPRESSTEPRRWGKPIVMTVALVALTGGLTAGSVARVSADNPVRPGTRQFVRANHPAPVNGPQLVDRVEPFGNHRP